MRKITNRPLGLAITALFIAMTATIGCGDDPVEEVDENNDTTNNDTTNNDTNNDNNDEEPPTCEATSWSCSEFVDGESLSERRHGHETVILDDGNALLVGGSRRYENHSSTSSETWELYDTTADEVITSGDFEDVRARPSLEKLDSGVVLAMGGTDDRDDRLSSVVYFDEEALEWLEAPSMSAGYSKSVHLPDDRVVAISASQPNEPREANLVGQVFDPDAWSWSGIETGKLPHDRIWSLNLQPVSGTEVLATYRHLAPEEAQPDPEENFSVYMISAVIYDIESGDVELLHTFEDIGTEAVPDVAWLPQMEKFLIQGRFFEFDEEQPTLAFLYDPADGSIEENYSREPSPGNILTVLPGDEVVYRSSVQIQRYKVETEEWRNFGYFPEGMYYSSLETLPDCRLFASGERTQGVPNDELRLVDTGYCVPE